MNHLTKLTELNLENNNISVIQGLDGLRELSILNLSKNKICKIEYMPCLPKVKFKIIYKIFFNFK